MSAPFSIIHLFLNNKNFYDVLKLGPLIGLLGATVARLTPDQKVACSNHVGVMPFGKVFVRCNIESLKFEDKVVFSQKEQMYNLNSALRFSTLISGLPI